MYKNLYGKGLLLFISLTLFACQTDNKKSIEIGSLSILEYPDSQELQVWIASDSQYRQVFQVRKYFEDFVYEDFFDEKEIQLKFNNLTWSKMVEYQKRYSNLLNKYSDIYHMRTKEKLCPTIRQKTNHFYLFHSTLSIQKQFLP